MLSQPVFLASDLVLCQFVLRKFRTSVCHDEARKSQVNLGDVREILTFRKSWCQVLSIDKSVLAVQLYQLSGPDTLIPISTVMLYSETSRLMPNAFLRACTDLFLPTPRP